MGTRVAPYPSTATQQGRLGGSRCAVPVVMKIRQVTSFADPAGARRPL